MRRCLRRRCRRPRSRQKKATTAHFRRSRNSIRWSIKGALEASISASSRSVRDVISRKLGLVAALFGIAGANMTEPYWARSGFLRLRHGAGNRPGGLGQRGPARHGRRACRGRALRDRLGLGRLRCLFLDGRIGGSIRIGWYPDVLQRPGEFATWVYRGTDLVPEAAPGGFHRLSDLVKFGLADRIVNGFTELLGQRTNLSCPLPHGAENFRDIPRPDDKEHHHTDDKDFRPANVQHQSLGARRTVPLRFGRFVGFRGGGSRRCGIFSARCFVRYFLRSIAVSRNLFLHT